MRFRRLTPREREVVLHAALGLTNKRIATLLSISMRTVEAHRANAMRKLELHSLPELVRYAIRIGLIEA